MKKRLAKTLLRAASIGSGWDRSPAPPEPTDPNAVQRILLWTMNALGDVVRMTPAIEALRQRFTNASITMVATPRAAPILHENPHIDEHILLKRPYSPKEHRAILGRLGQPQWDMAVLMEVNPDWVALEARHMRRLRARRVYAFDFGKGTPKGVQAVRLGDRGSWIDQFNLLASATGAITTSRDTRVYLRNEERSRARQLLGEVGLAPGDRFAVVHPGGNFRSVSRQWAPERFAEVIRQMRDRHGIRSVLTGVEGERATIERVASEAGDAAINLCARLSMRELASVLDLAAICLMNDTGPLHIAHALGRPSVAILGPTGAEVVGVPKSGSVVRVDLPCSPCAFFTGWRSCVNPRKWECLEAITPTAVLSEVERRLDGALPLPVIGS